MSAPTQKELLIDEKFSTNLYYFGLLMSKCNGSVLIMASEISAIAALEPTDPEECILLWIENQ
ncbi:MAG TPA: hypothetical protein PLI67_11375 [Niabella sp.]|nr:hypothetical protein [Niabella sp.]